MRILLQSTCNVIPLLFRPWHVTLPLLPKANSFRPFASMRFHPSILHRLCQDGEMVFSLRSTVSAGVKSQRTIRLAFYGVPSCGSFVLIARLRFRLKLPIREIYCTSQTFLIAFLHIRFQPIIRTIKFIIRNKIRKI